MRLAARLLLATVALAMAAAACTSTSRAPDEAAHRHRLPPIRTSAQLAARIAAHDRAAGSSGPFHPAVQVTCRAMTPSGDLAGRYDHRCRESYLGAICTTRSAPEIDILLIDVRGRTYRTYNDDTVDDGACSPP